MPKLWVRALKRASSKSGEGSVQSKSRGFSFMDRICLSNFREIFWKIIFRAGA